jgi:hypothetical protein
MTRQAGYDYIEKRRYSYADRITWKTGHELNHGVYPLLYESIDNFTSSDHKPVRAAFAVKLNRNMQMVPRRSVNHLPSIADLGNLLGMTLGTAKSSENTTTTTTTTTTSNIPHSRSLHLMVSHIKCTLSQAPRPFKKVIYWSPLRCGIHHGNGRHCGIRRGSVSDAPTLPQSLCGLV